MNVLLDTNIPLRLSEVAHPLYRVTLDATNALSAQGHTLFLVPQNYYEFWVVSTRPLAQNGRGKSPGEVAAEFAFLETQFAFFPDTAAVFDEWKRLVAAYRVSGKPSHDARLVAAMLAHGITHILTFNDQDFRRVTAVTPAGVLPPPP